MTKPKVAHAREAERANPTKRLEGVPTRLKRSGASAAPGHSVPVEGEDLLHHLLHFRGGPVIQFQSFDVCEAGEAKRP